MPYYEERFKSSREKKDSNSAQKSSNFGTRPFGVQQYPTIGVADKQTRQELYQAYLQRKEKSSKSNNNISFGPSKPWIEPEQEAKPLISSSTQVIQRTDDDNSSTTEEITQETITQVALSLEDRIPTAASFKKKFETDKKKSFPQRQRPRLNRIVHELAGYESAGDANTLPGLEQRIIALRGISEATGLWLDAHNNDAKKDNDELHKRKRFQDIITIHKDAGALRFAYEEQLRSVAPTSNVLEEQDNPSVIDTLTSYKEMIKGGAKVGAIGGGILASFPGVIAGGMAGATAGAGIRTAIMPFEKIVLGAKGIGDATALTDAGKQQFQETAQTMGKLFASLESFKDIAKNVASIAAWANIIVLIIGLAFPPAAPVTAAISTILGIIGFLGASLQAILAAILTGRANQLLKQNKYLGLRAEAILRHRRTQGIVDIITGSIGSLLAGFVSTVGGGALDAMNISGIPQTAFGDLSQGTAVGGTLQGYGGGLVDKVSGEYDDTIMDEDSKNTQAIGKQDIEEYLKQLKQENESSQQGVDNNNEHVKRISNSANESVEKVKEQQQNGSIAEKASEATSKFDEAKTTVENANNDDTDTLIDDEQLQVLDRAYAQDPKSFNVQPGQLRSRSLSDPNYLNAKKAKKKEKKSLTRRLSDSGLGRKISNIKNKLIAEARKATQVDEALDEVQNTGKAIEAKTKPVVQGLQNEAESYISLNTLSAQAAKSLKALKKPRRKNLHKRNNAIDFDNQTHIPRQRKNAIDLTNDDYVVEPFDD